METKIKYALSLFDAYYEIYSNETYEVLLKDIKPYIQSNDCDINFQDNEGYTILMYAVQREFVGLVKLLIEDERCDLNLREDDEKLTALMIALDYTDNCEIIKMLSQHKRCDLLIGNDDNKNVFLLACDIYYFSNFEKVKTLFESWKSDINLIDGAEDMLSEITTKSILDANLEDRFEVEKTVKYFLDRGIQISDDLRAYETCHDLILNEAIRRRNVIGVLLISLRAERMSSLDIKRKWDDPRKNPLNIIPKKLIHLILSYSHPLAPQTKYC